MYTQDIFLTCFTGWHLFTNLDLIQSRISEIFSLRLNNILLTEPVGIHMLWFQIQWLFHYEPFPFVDHISTNVAKIETAVLKCCSFDSRYSWQTKWEEVFCRKWPSSVFGANVSFSLKQFHVVAFLVLEMTSLTFLGR